MDSDLTILYFTNITWISSQETGNPGLYHNNKCLFITHRDLAVEDVDEYDGVAVDTAVKD